MILPDFCGIIRRAADCVQKMLPLTLVWNTRSRSASVLSIRLALCTTPALLTMMSSLP